MEDYINYLTPQFSRTHINFQRVPTVDTSNPFAAKTIPSLDESFVVIHFRNLEGIDYPWAAGDAAGLVYFAHEYVSGTRRKNGAGDGAHHDAAGGAVDGREADCVSCSARWRCAYRAYVHAFVGRVSEAPPAKRLSLDHFIRMRDFYRFLQH